MEAEGNIGNDENKKLHNGIWTKIKEYFEGYRHHELFQFIPVIK